MSVELSRRIALLATTPAMLKVQAEGDYMDFLKAVEKADDFDDLDSDYQKLIEKAESQR